MHGPATSTAGHGPRIRHACSGPRHIPRAGCAPRTYREVATPAWRARRSSGVGAEFAQAFGVGSLADGEPLTLEHHGRAPLCSPRAMRYG